MGVNLRYSDLLLSNWYLDFNSTIIASSSSVRSQLPFIYNPLTLLNNSTMGGKK
jgi:hypothetical protein